VKRGGFHVTDVIRDARGRRIYLTDERWRHIIDTHPEMTPFRGLVVKTIRLGGRRQDPLDPAKFKYSRKYSGLPPNFTHIVVVVKFETRFKPTTKEEQNNFVLTAYLVSRVKG
jgi:hypothetical protein